MTNKGTQKAENSHLFNERENERKFNIWEWVRAERRSDFSGWAESGAALRFFVVDRERSAAPKIKERSMLWWFDIPCSAYWTSKVKMLKRRRHAFVCRLEHSIIADVHFQQLMLLASIVQISRGGRENLFWPFMAPFSSCDNVILDLNKSQVQSIKIHCEFYGYEEEPRPKFFFFNMHAEHSSPFCSFCLINKHEKTSKKMA